MKTYKYGLFIGHIAPIHNGHIHVIKTMVDECECSHIMLLERDSLIPTFKCQALFDQVVDCLNLKDCINVIHIPDLFNEEWGAYIYYNICRIIKRDSFAYYFSGNKRETIEQFPSLLANRIIFRYIPQYNGITSQRVRDSLLSHDYNYIAESCPAPVFRDRYKLTEIIKRVV